MNTTMQSTQPNVDRSDIIKTWNHLMTAIDERAAGRLPILEVKRAALRYIMACRECKEPFFIFADTTRQDRNIIPTNYPHSGQADLPTIGEAYDTPTYREIEAIVNTNMKQKYCD